MTSYGTTTGTKPTELRHAKERGRGGQWRDDMRKGMVKKFNLKAMLEKNMLDAKKRGHVYVVVMDDEVYHDTTDLEDAREKL